MTRWLLCIALTLFGACGPPLVVQTTPTSLPAHPLELAWSMKLINAGATLRIDYRITNHSGRAYFVSDVLPVSGKLFFTLDPKMISVANGDTPGQVRFVRGRLASIVPMMMVNDPGVRVIGPGESLDGNAEVRFPLTAQHYQGRLEALAGTPTRAVLAIGYLAELHPVRLKLDDGGTVLTSHPSDDMDVVTSTELPIPTQ